MSCSQFSACYCICSALCTPAPHRCDLRLKICLSPKKPAIQLMNDTNNRSCRTIGLYFPKHVSWHTVKNKTEKLQLNFKEKPHLDISISLCINLVKSDCPTGNYREKYLEIKSHKLNQTSPQRKWSLGATGRKTWRGNKARLLFFRNSYLITAATDRSLHYEK